MTLTIGVDTNILCNFGKFEHLRWEKLFPGVENLRILVAHKVRKEMDVHKGTMTGYLFKRAMEFQRFLRAAENSDDYRTVGTFHGVEVELVFLPRPLNKVLDTEVFDLDDADELIAAQYSYVREFYGDFTLLSNDGNAIEAAKRVGMKTKRPDEWVPERTADLDEEMTRLRVENKALKKENDRYYNSRPALAITSLVVAHAPIYLSHELGDVFDEFCSEMNEKLAKVDVPEYNDLLSAFDRIQKNQTASQLFDAQKWCHQYDWVRKHFYSFFVDEKSYLEEDLSILFGSGELSVVVENKGVAADEDIFIEVRVIKNCRLRSIDGLRANNNTNLWWPRIPAALSGEFPDYLVDRNPQNEDYRPSNEIESEDFFELQVPSLLHGRKLVFPVFFQLDRPADQIELVVTVRSRNLTKPITRKAEIVASIETPTPEQYKALLRERLKFLPPEQAEIFGLLMAEPDAQPLPERPSRSMFPVLWSGDSKLTAGYDHTSSSS